MENNLAKLRRIRIIESVAVLIVLGFLATHSSWSLVRAHSDFWEGEDPQTLTAALANLPQENQLTTLAASSSTPQFVLLSFDGSKSVAMLNETLNFEQQMITENKPLHFTYFVNAAYFVPDKKAFFASNIGFGGSEADIANRADAFNQAVELGNAIGSHSVGHWNGASWSAEQWQQEFNSFNHLMGQFPFAQKIAGFRAPDLGVNDNLYRTLSDFHFAYDASGVGAMGAWPKKDAYGVWHIPLGTITIGPGNAPTISMDYSLWIHQSGGQEEAVKGTPLWNEYYTEVLNAYRHYFNHNYYGSRAPVVIGHHFSKLNDGVYWEALKTFASEVCGQPNVRCATFPELVDYLNNR